MIKTNTLTEQCPHCGAIARMLARDQARSADKKVITNVSIDNVEMDELHGFAGKKHPDEQESDLEEVDQHWTHTAMAREARLMLEAIVGPRTHESVTKLVEGAAERLAPDCWPLQYDCD